MGTALVTYVIAGLAVSAYVVRLAAIDRRLAIRGQHLEEPSAEQNADAPARQSA